MKALALILILALAVPATAGGPVLVEDTTETAAPAKALTPGEKVGLAILGLIIIGAIASGGGGDATTPGGKLCFGDPVPPSTGC
jgi:hypothetical protein